MGGLFSKPKLDYVPPVETTIEPTLITETDQDMQDEDLARRRRKLSRPKSIITGDLTPDTGKKGVLG